MTLVAVVTVAIAMLFVVISEPKPNTDNVLQIQTFHYDVDPEDLATRPLAVETILSKQNVPSRTCFEINDTNLEKFPPGFKTGLSIFESKKKTPGYLLFESDVGIGMTRDEALNLISEYQFDLTKTVTDENSKKIPNNNYDFQCYFDYKSSQYSLDIHFGPYYPDSSGFVNVNFTKDYNGNPITTNTSIVTFERFNDTIIFNNDLGSNITLSITGPDFWNSTKIITMEYKIPSGKPFPFLSRIFSHQDSAFSYSVKEYNLNGTILFKHIPSLCLSESESISLFSQFGLKPEFPSYLPKALDHKCLRYGDPDLNYQFSNYSIDPQSVPFYNQTASFYEKGGLEIHYSVSDYVYRGFTGHNYTKIDYSKRCGDYSKFCKVMEINGKTVVLDDQYFPRSIEWYTDKERYEIVGNYSMNELVKIAQSMK